MLKWPTLARAGGTGVTAPLPMPRECRDTLFLLAVIAWVVLPHAARLPLWCAVMTGAVLVWRAVLAWQARPLPGVLVRVALLALAVGATWFSHRTVLGRDAGVTLIVVLLALKTLELRARRDAFVVFFLGFFTLLTHFFFSQSLLTALAILLALLGLMTALVNAHMPAGTPTLWQSARIALRLAAVGTPVMIALFLLFPRLAPLWGLPSDSQLGAPVCRRACAWGRSRSWCWTTAWPCASASTAPGRAGKTYTFAGRCSVTLMAASGGRERCCAPTSRRPTCRSPASRCATR